MSQSGISIEIPDLLKYNHHVVKNPSAKSFAGHSHNQYEIIYFLSGDATHVIEDKRYKLKAGDLIITRPSKYHFIQMDSIQDYERHDILFDHKRLGIDTSPIPDGMDVVRVENNGIISDIFLKLDRYSCSFERGRFMDVAKLLIQEIIYNLPLTARDTEEGFAMVNPLLSDALAYIADNLFTIKDISEVAGAVFVTESYLYRLFKKELKKTPKKYITEKRLLHAQNRLKKGARPTDVASACGFDDYTTFYRNYTDHFGKPPSEER
jgi:AraC-like DNA-binding protein